MKKIYARPAYCMNCHLCEVNCIVAHSRSRDLFRAYKRENLRGTARVIVEERLPLSVAVQCRHCDEPACVAGCISGAMVKDRQTGIVYCQENRCVGCWTCVAGCPYGAVRPGEKNGRPVPLKCDLCREADAPACVAGCPNRALVFAERRAGS